eukprot:TRINITY_DN3092_c0_g1_i4.p1 TRINITY_DN3092_c0_g1~~TRINITY_DN3092_c0_g1_i4.p1  ORF type:complete len:135 (+),score=10.38 TRINITY_DN3092_c0_g1_i4:115-519(+)
MAEIYTERLAVTPPKDRESPFKAPDWASLPNPRPGASMYLEVRKGENELVARYNIGEHKLWIIGRNQQLCQIPSFHDSISRQHTAICYHGRKKSYYVIDLKSFHGTSIDGRKLDPWEAKPRKCGPCLALTVALP